MNEFVPPQENILLIDDDVNNLCLLSKLLESHGYQVKKAIDASFALQGLEVIKPDLILLDVNMPKLNGYEVCKILKSKPKTANIPVIFISASDQLVDKVTAFQVGGVDYITKPFHWEEVVVRVENQLTQKRLTLQLKEQNQLLKNLLEERQRIQLQLLEANQKLSQLAFLDGLTSLANRRKFDDFLQEEWQKHCQYNLALSLILCDVDYFKNYNDTYGHLQGDDCLKRIAQTLSITVNCPSSLVARYGGEEFAIILPNTDGQNAKNQGEAICQAIHNLKIPHTASPVADFVTISLGVTTTIPNSETNPKRLILITDKVLYEAKTQGRNRLIAWQI